MGKIKGKKIIVIGNAGSGKSTFAALLGKKTKLPVVHLDQLFWKENWEITSHNEWINIVKEVIVQDEWIIDGNFNSTMELRMHYADMIIFFDISRFICMYSIVKRWLRHLNVARPDMNSGCKEGMKLKNLRIIFRLLKNTYCFEKKHKPSILKRLEKFDDKPIIIINNRKMINEIIDKIEKYK